MEHRPLEHRGREVGERAAVREKAQLRRDDATAPIAADAILGPVGMALPRRPHVVVLTVDDARGATGAIDHQRRHQRRDRRLRLLAAEAASHPPHQADHLVLAAAQHLGHHGLDLARVLRRGVNEELARFAGPGQGRLTLQVELFLAAALEHAFEHQVGGAECGGEIAARDPALDAEIETTTVGLLDREHRRLFVDDETDRGTRRARGGARLGGDDGDRLTDVAHPVRGQERLVGEDRTEHVVARNVGMGVDADDALDGERRGGVDRAQSPVGARTRHEVDHQLTFESRQILDVVRGAGHVAAGGLVRRLLARSPGGG